MMRLRRVQRATVPCAEGVLAADAAQVDRLRGIAVDIDVLGAAAAPAVHVIQQAQAVDEAEQRPWTVRVHQQEFLALALRRHLPPPACVEAARLRQRLAGIAAPVDL